MKWRLETLESDVAAHSAQMEEMLQGISEQRDFNKNLLDTAQVIILTQSSDGQILTLNRYGRQLLGWTEDDLQGKRFPELVCPDGSSEPAIDEAVQKIAAGELDDVQLESILASASGAPYKITWNHSRLSGSSDVVMIRTFE